VQRCQVHTPCFCLACICITDFKYRINIIRSCIFANTYALQDTINETGKVITPVDLPQAAVIKIRNVDITLGI